MPEYLTTTVFFSKGHRNALPWTDVTLIISYEWTQLEQVYKLQKVMSFSRYEQVYITQKVCVSGPRFMGLIFSCIDGYYHLSKYSTLFFSNTLYIG
ncbi:hypothetical protein C0J52_19678 [Blattella germanica]|nr:hypothetical protein C0J52_19678 [Blattella germanica]